MSKKSKKLIRSGGQQSPDAAGPAQRRYLRDRLHGAQQVRGVGQHHEPRLGTQGRGDGVRADDPPLGRDDRQPDPPGAGRVQRPQRRVVLEVGRASCRERVSFLV